VISWRPFRARAQRELQASPRLEIQMLLSHAEARGVCAEPNGSRLDGLEAILARGVARGLVLAARTIDQDELCFGYWSVRIIAGTADDLTGQHARPRQTLEWAVHLSVDPGPACRDGRQRRRIGDEHRALRRSITVGRNLEPVHPRHKFPRHEPTGVIAEHAVRSEATGANSSTNTDVPVTPASSAAVACKPLSQG